MSGYHLNPVPDFLWYLNQMEHRILLTNPAGYFHITAFLSLPIQTVKVDLLPGSWSAHHPDQGHKNLTGLLNQIEKGKIGFFSFVNAKVFELAETELQVINIDFTAGEVTQAEFIGLVIMDVTADCVKRESTAAGTIVVPIPTTSAAESNLSINADMKKDTDIVRFLSFLLFACASLGFLPTHFSDCFPPILY